mgnify:CR=1 FL=1
MEVRQSLLHRSLAKILKPGKRPTEEGEGRQADDSSGHRKARTRQLVGKNRRSQPKRKPTTGEEVPILTDICVYPTTRLPSGGTSPHEGEYERFYPKIPPYPTSHFRQGVKLSSYGGGGEERSPCREGYSRDSFSSRSRWEWESNPDFRPIGRNPRIVG